MTWDDFNSTFLSAAAKTKAQEFAAIGAALNASPGATPDISSVTYSQMRAADAKMRELHTLVGPALKGLNYVKSKLEDGAVQAFNDANP